jgi:hypothetical protein
MAESSLNPVTDLALLFDTGKGSVISTAISGVGFHILAGACRIPILLLPFAASGCSMQVIRR